ncbi:unnamed protein product [Rhizopus stolonifer]
MQSLQETMNDLEKSRDEKEVLENYIRKQQEIQISSRQWVEEKSRMNQQLNDRVMDLIFQKEYLMLENNELKKSESELLRYVDHQPFNLKGVSKWKSAVWAIIALQRFYKAIY